MKLRFFLPILTISIFAIFMVQTHNETNKQASINPTAFAGHVLYIDLNLFPNIDLNLFPKGCSNPHYCGTSCSISPFSGHYCNDESCNECHISKSLEFTNIYDCFIKACKENETMSKYYTDLNIELHDKYNKGLINNATYTAKITELQDKFNQLAEKQNTAYQSFYQATQSVEQKLIVIGKCIAKNLGASALIKLEEDKQIYVDPTYDITQIAIDQLNDDYTNQR
ncbi:hypothetical protein E3J79_03160 [Candidatus Dependentiae bacterium]|nr:MAG: hypothetical protein E3J79_03160 [Candidatus Dependentiae bacterium]